MQLNYDLNFLKIFLSVFGILLLYVPLGIRFEQIFSASRLFAFRVGRSFTGEGMNINSTSTGVARYSNLSKMVPFLASARFCAIHFKSHIR